MSRSKSTTAPLPTAPLVAAALAGGYSLGRLTGVRPLAAIPLVVGGVLAGREWLKVGVPQTIALTASFLGVFGLAHPAGKRIGTWPAVLGAAGAAGTVTAIVADRHADWS